MQGPELSVRVGRCAASGMDIELCYQWVRSSHPVHGPLILIGGLADQLVSWEGSLCSKLCNSGFDVLRFDNRDVGKSTKVESAAKGSVAYRLDDMAQDVLGLMDRLQLDTAHVCGQSMGGGIAQQMLLKAPQRLRSVTIVMSTGRWDPQKNLDEDVQRVFFTAPESDSVGDLTAHRLHVWKHILLPSPAVFSRWEAHAKQDAARLYARSTELMGVARQHKAITQTGDSLPKLAKLPESVQRRVMIVHGLQDRLVPVRYGEELVKAMPFAHRTFLDGMGHRILPTFEDAFAGALTLHARSSQGKLPSKL